MSQDHSLAERRSRIDRRLETVFESIDSEPLELAQATMAACDDRWYGQLVGLTHESVCDDSASDRVIPAATAIELLRGYNRLRSELLAQIDTGVGRSVPQDPTSALLAGDFLYSAAYSTLGSVDHTKAGECFEVLTTVSETIIQAFSANYGQPESTIEPCSIIDQTAGALGEGAAVVGATFAGVDSSRRELFASVGRGVSIARQIQRILNGDAGTVPLVPSTMDDRELLQYRTHHLESANQALRHLSSTTDIESLREFIERTSTVTISD